jgi:hypothetical protein
MIHDRCNTPGELMQRDPMGDVYWCSKCGRNFFGSYAYNPKWEALAPGDEVIILSAQCSAEVGKFEYFYDGDKASIDLRHRDPPYNSFGWYAREVWKLSDVREAVATRLATRVNYGEEK